MSRFFVAPENVGVEYITIENREDLHHMNKVLRLKAGDEIDVSDGDMWEYHGKILSLEPECCQVEILDKQKFSAEPETKITLFQGIPKQGKMELIVQKAVELGVYQVIPVAMKRSVVRLDDKKAAKKADRWNSIAESAAKQAGRSRIPEVTMPLSYNEALKMAEELDVTLLPYELAGGMEVTREVIRQIKSGQSVGIFIGPEGGFEPEEVDAAVSMGAKVITLGRRILRTETAGLATLAVLMFELEQ